MSDSQDNIHTAEDGEIKEVEVTAITISTEDRITELADKICQIYYSAEVSNARHRYEIGETLKEVYEDQKTDGSLYGKNVFEQLAELVSQRLPEPVKAPTLRNYMKVAVVITREEFDQMLAVPGSSYSKILTLAEKVEEPAKRLELLQEAKDSSSRAFDEKVREATESTEDNQEKNDALAKQQSASAPGESKTTGTNVFGPPKKVLKHYEPLLDAIGDMTLLLQGGLEFDTDKQRDNFHNRIEEVEQALETLGDSAEALHTLIAEAWHGKGFNESVGHNKKPEPEPKAEKKPKAEAKPKAEKPKPAAEKKPKAEPKPKAEKPATAVDVSAARERAKAAAAKAREKAASRNKDG